MAKNLVDPGYPVEDLLEIAWKRLKENLIDQYNPYIVSAMEHIQLAMKLITNSKEDKIFERLKPRCDQTSNKNLYRHNWYRHSWYR